MDSLVGMRTFVRVAEVGSFAEAGRVLGISSSAVGKMIGKLEDEHRVRLFHRSTRSLTLTPEGAMFLSRCQRILAEIAAAEAELSEAAGTPRGRLRVSVPLVTGLMSPLIHSFSAAFPAIELDVDLSNRLVDIVEEGFDVVIRTGDLSDSRLVSRQLGVVPRVIVGSPAYFDRHGEPQTPLALLEHRCLLHRFPGNGRIERWRLRLPESREDLPLAERTLLGSVEAIAHLARLGDGLACLPEFLVRDELASGALRRVLDDFIDDPVTFWAVWPASRHAAPKVRAFVEHARRHLFPPA